jgi:hypothetical protein
MLVKDNYIVWMKGNRLIGTVHKIIDEEQGKIPEGTGA